jgi:tetratricopeptide (TPR) repeat protein
MERRLAVLAEALTGRGARRTWMAALVLASIAGPASASPKKRDAKAAFDRGVAAYKKNNFEAASAALGKSFELEADVDTLFAWAQSERKLDHCDKAADLYDKLLTFPLPAENKTAVEQKLAECRQLLAALKPVEPAPVVAPTPAPAVVVAPPPPPEPVVTDARHRPWYKDPIALGLTGTGVVALGVGAGFLVSAKNAHDSVAHAANYQVAKNDSDHAKSRGTTGVIVASAGGALIVGGVVWIFTHRNSGESPPMTAWLGPTGGGLAFIGGF